ncbi:uncharacterized protein LOC114240689 [Bombyx mandarina]|uniref:Uncharacterized protein LOC114240689 n=1 Tax=Bombyx mandarina TaxID=7092 RepID=A0A6J2JCV7_BOMMA|nr:uncharacterized protein LOC114240689 [Bombyx mandarina]
MWYTWTTLLLVSCALVEAAEVEVTTTEAVVPAVVTTTRPPPRTLDRLAAELAWKSWLQSPESGNPNAPRRRITTKSLFITPLVCPKGQRLDGNGCVQTVTVNKDEHERILLEELNAQFKPTLSGDVTYYDNYDENEPGPLQLSIPIGLDPLAAPLQGQGLSDQASQGSHDNINKKDGNKPVSDASIEAELELLKLQHSHNDTGLPDGAGVLNHNVLTNFHFAEKPKRDSPLNATEIETINNMADQGQKEVVYGHVNIDPILYGNQQQLTDSTSKKNDIPKTDTLEINASTESNLGSHTKEEHKQTDVKVASQTQQVLSKNGEQSKLNPENDYSDIGEAIKLISRYAEVTTDDNFSKDQKNQQFKEEGVLGTRTKLQHRRNRPQSGSAEISFGPLSTDIGHNIPDREKFVNKGIIYRYPWPNQQFRSPPPGYPFQQLQDYWPGQNKLGGVYNGHENPRRHHHSYPHNFRPREFGVYPGMQEPYPEQLRRYIHRVVQHHSNPQRSHDSQDLYSLLGLRHWFSSEDTTKR